MDKYTSQFNMFHRIKTSKIPESKWQTLIKSNDEVFDDANFLFSSTKPDSLKHQRAAGTYRKLSVFLRVGV